MSCNFPGSAAAAAPAHAHPPRHPHHGPRPQPDGTGERHVLRAPHAHVVPERGHPPPTAIPHRGGRTIATLNPHQPLLTDAYLLSEWADDLDRYTEEDDAAVLKQLADWATRDRRQLETQLEGPFVGTLLCGLLGHRTTGGALDAPLLLGHDSLPTGTYTAFPQFPVENAGQTGGTGKADVAFGLFHENDTPPRPQVLSEFKDIRSGLDLPQARKGNNRSPVGQAFAYLKHAFDATPVQEPVKPAWALVTDMEEFRLYSRTHGQQQYQRFVLHKRDLLAETPRGRRRRFLFRKTFGPGQLLSRTGVSPLRRLLDGQITHERKLEKTFYLEYSAYRKKVYRGICDANHGYGSRSEMVTLTQRFLDRCLFVLFCEDMGQTVGFPPNLLQKLLVDAAGSSFHAPTTSTIWPQVQALFHAMSHGGDFPPDHTIERFNGGLFAEDPRLDGLKIPNHLFCARAQGVDDASLSRNKETLLYLSASYNFGNESDTGDDGVDDGGRTITLYTLGRIFEQSITELEHLHAEASDRDTPAKLAKRKRDGVYYTPEWVVRYIVEETVGRRLRDERAAMELELGREFDLAELADFRTDRERKNKLKKKHQKFVDHERLLGDYADFVDRLKVLDPACGSGAFLIGAMQFLRQHYQDLADESERVFGTPSLRTQDEITRGILARNLHGVDINPESVEITQLALWLHTATKGQPLTTLDDHIRCGNSLVGPDYRDFYQQRTGTLFGTLTTDEQDLVNVFDWAEAFPDVLGDEVPADRRGFDCVIGNPPYVKLQHMRKIKEDEVVYLMEQTRTVGEGDEKKTEPLYRSTRTGNFDLYLPFIERGLDLLNPDGRMGYIAPSVWLKNEYGEGLKEVMAQRGVLDRWVDFGHAQVFEDVTVYTALQFFAKKQRDAFQFHRVDGNAVGELEWDDATPSLPVAATPAGEPWLLMEEAERRLFDRLAAEFPRLDDERLTETMFQGLVTSMDKVFHSYLREDGLFQSDLEEKPLALEAELMKPLVSGGDARRYVDPSTTRHLLFPYHLVGGEMKLHTEEEMESRFPQAWAFLKRHEEDLRKRDGGKTDEDGRWYGFVYPKSLDKHERPKLGIPQTVTELRVFADPAGAFYFNNVRVNGILPRDPEDLFYLMGILNSRVADWCFKQGAAPKANGYFEANNQYVDPIPVPLPDAASRAAVGDAARELQRLTTERRDAIAAFSARVASPQCVPEKFPADWLFADTKTSTIRDLAPADLGINATKRWIKETRAARLAVHHELINNVLVPDAPLTVAAEDGDLFLRFRDRDLLTRYGVGGDAPYLAALWRHQLRTNRITPGTDAAKLTKLLLNLRTTDDPTFRANLLTRDEKLQALESDIARLEAETNEEVTRLYRITHAELSLL